MSMKDVMHLVCSATELENVRVRDEELKELDSMKVKAPIAVKGGVENCNGKSNVYYKLTSRDLLLELLH